MCGHTPDVVTCCKFHRNSFRGFEPPAVEICTFPLLWLLVFGRPFVKRFALCYRTARLSVCLSVLSVCNVGVLWPNGWADKDETWRAGMPQPLPGCVRWGQLPSPKRGTALPQFSAHICHGQMAGWIKMPLGRKVGINPSDVVLDGDPAPPPPKGGRAPNFRPIMSIVAKQQLDG